MAASQFINPSNAGVVTSAQVLSPDGTAGAPAYSYASEPTLGIWRLAAGTLQMQATSVNLTGSILTSGANGYYVGTTGFVGWQNRTFLYSPNDGGLNVVTNSGAIGSRLKVDALPTVASGFGTSPSITAGSTPFAGSINVGTGGTATAGVINFNGTAFPSTPFIALSTQLGSLVIVTAISATQFTLGCTGAVAFVSGDVISWICVSAK